MKGLLRNNLYSALHDLKRIIPLCFLAMVGALMFNDAEFTTLVVLCQMTACFGHIGTGMKKDSVAKWDRFEITMPVKRGDVVVARYLSFLLFALMGITVSLTTVGLSAMLGNALSYERIQFALAGGITIIFLTPALTYPMMIRFGNDHVEVILMYALMASMGIFVAGEFLWAHAGLVFYGTWMVGCSLLAFFGSCLLSIVIYQKKEC